MALESPRLVFRSWRADDLDLARALWGDPAVTRFLHAAGAFSPDEIAARLAEEIARQREYGVQYWPMFTRDDGDLAGCCGLRPHRLAEGIYELGVHLRPAYWGRGLAREASKAVIEYAWEVVGARALFAGHHPDNRRSAKVLRSLGFRYTHAEPYDATGLRHPSYLLSSPSRPGPDATGPR